MSEIQIDCQLAEIIRSDPRGLRKGHSGEELTMAYAELFSAAVAERLELLAKAPVRSVQADSDDLIVNLLGAAHIEIILRFRPGKAGLKPPELSARIKAPPAEIDAVEKLVLSVKDDLLGSPGGAPKA